MTKKIFIILALLVGLLLRLYKIDSPVADWHSFRQADTASVTKIFSEQGIDLLHPRYHDLSNVQSGLNNPQGYRMVEVPLYNAISVYFHQIFKTNIDVSSRLVSIILSLASALLIYLICYQTTKLFLPSFFALCSFIFLPFNIYYSRTILPEPTAVFFMLLSLYFFRVNLLFSSIALALSILVKPYTAILLFPVFLTYTLIYRPKIIKLVLFALITLLPFYFWRKWIGQFPEGIPKSDWLLNNGNTTTFPVWYKGYNLTFLNQLVAFRPHWFEWLFFQRLSNLILGAFGIIPLFLGLVYKKNHTQAFSFSLIAGIVLYFIIVAQGNIQHDYYQVLIIPIISILLGFGYYYLLKFTFSSRAVSLLAILVIFLFSSYFSFITVKGYYQVNNNSILLAGSKAKEILPSSSLVIAPYTGDTAFLYQTGFRGWPVEVYNLDDIVKSYPQHPLYLVSVNYDQYTNSLIPKYQTVEKTKDYIILQINHGQN